MKLTALALAASLFSSLASAACLSQAGDRYCTGDPVVVEYLPGEIVGVSLNRQLVSVRFINGAINTYPISDVLIGKGCLGKLCVGEGATVEFLSGEIIAISRAEQKVSIRFTNGAIQTYPVDRVTVAQGCLERYCVGDGAVVEYLEGEIIGINRQTRNLSIRFINGATNTYPIERVSIAKGCLDEYCVGDAATVEWLSGEIVAINRYNDSASIRFTNGAINTYPISQISIGSH